MTFTAENISHEDAHLVGMLSLPVILFSGGMDTKRRDIEPVASQGLMLSTVGVLITTVASRPTALAASVV